MDLLRLGWHASFESSFAPFSAAGYLPARVACEHKHSFSLYTPTGVLDAACTGRLLHEARSRADLPSVGDWVVVKPRPRETFADIHAVLPRRTKFSRRASGPRPDEQIVAANVDVVLLVTALDANYNPRRIERFLAVAWESGAQPVVVLNKSDLHADPAGAQHAISLVAPGAPVLVISALDGTGLAGLSPYLHPGHTVAVLGSSGVGKSTLINALLGEVHQDTGATRENDSRGRHTTTRRELLLAPSGALIMDTPGMRELQFHEDEASVEDTFADILEQASRCRFSDCSHRAEPGCAVQAGLADGTIAEDRWRSYQKLAREQTYAARKADTGAARREKAVWKKINAGQRARRSWEQRNEIE